MFLPLVLVLLSFLATFCPAVTASAALVSALAANNSGLFSPDQKSAERQSDNVTLTDYGRIGVCYSYLSFFCTDYKDGWNRDKMLEACKIYCPTQQLSDGYGCLAPPNISLSSELDPSIIYQDDEGLHWTPGLCDCELEIAEDLFDIIAEGLSKLDSVLCSVFASIFTDVLEVAVAFTPIGDLYDITDTIISTVKTFDQNVLTPMDYFNNFLGSKCGIQGISADPISLFGILAGASNGLGTSKGCKRKNPAACAQPKDNPDPSPDVPRSPEKDPWEGDGAPSTDVPVYCDNTASARFVLEKRKGKSKCAKIPSIEGNGYTYQDKAASNPGQYMPNTFSLQCPDKWTKGAMNDAAIFRLQPEYNRITVEYAYLDTIDTVKKLKLRDMIAGIWSEKLGHGVEMIDSVVHQSFVSKVWIGRDVNDLGVRGKVLDLLGKNIGDTYSLAVTDTGNAKAAFNAILKETPQAAGVYKMLETYAGGQGRQITRFDITREGGQDCLYITISQGATT